MTGRKDAATPRSKAGRRFTPLLDDGTAIAKLKLYVRACIKNHTLSQAALWCNASVSTLSKALNGTSLPNRLLVTRIVRQGDGSKEAVGRADALWRLAAIENLGLHPKDLAFPNPRTVAELATLLRGYLVDQARQHELTPEAVALLSRNDTSLDQSLSLSTVNRMLAGKKLPSDKALATFLLVIGINAAVRTKLLTARAAIERQEKLVSRQVAV